MNRQSIAIALLSLALAGSFGTAMVAADDAPALQSMRQQRATLSGNEARLDLEVEPAPPVTSFGERLRVHDSIVRLMRLRRDQAREDPQVFWENYKIGGREDVLARIISVQAEEKPLKEVLGDVAADVGTRFETTTDIDSIKIDVSLADKPFADALSAISQMAQVVPIYDRFEDSYVIVDLREPKPQNVLEDHAIPVRYSDPQAFLDFARQLGFDEGEAQLTINPEGGGFLVSGSMDVGRELRGFIRDFDRRRPPEGEQFVHEIIELQHTEPRTIVMQLWRAFPGNFGYRGNKIGVITTPGEIEAVRQRIAEHDQPVTD